MKEANDQLTDELAALTSGEALRSKQLSDLQSHNTVSQQSWARERGVLEAEGQGLRRQLQAATQSIQDWEIVALEERAARAGLTDKVAELEDRLAGARITNEALASERHDQSQTVDGLQRALRDIQEGTVIMRPNVTCYS